MPVAKEEIIKRATQADELIYQLRKEISNLRNSLVTRYHQEEENKLMKENEFLKLQIEECKNKLVCLEISHGIKQVSIPQQAVVKSENSGNDTSNIPQPTNKAKETKEKNAVSKEGKPEKAKPQKPASAVEVIDVSRLDLRIGRIFEVTKHPDADGLYVEQIDVGEEKPRTIISGLVKHIQLEELKNRMVLVLCNLKPVKMRGIASEGMVMCASSGETVEVLSPPDGVVPGEIVTCDGYEGKPDAQLNPKKKIFEQVAPDLKTNEQFLANYKGSILMVKGKGPIKSSTLANAFVK